MGRILPDLSFNPRLALGPFARVRSQVTGRILSVQEDRFRIMTDDGETLLLTLAKYTLVGMRDLQRWHAENRRLRVEYTGTPNLASGIAWLMEVVPDKDPDLARGNGKR